MERLPKRRNIRLKDYDYSQAGYYFITICTQDKRPILGEIVMVDDPVCPQAVMKANRIGEIVYEYWNRINDIYENVKTDAFCLMPNHIHGILVISEGGQGRPSLPKIIQGYKSVTTRMCFQHNLKTLWQRNYYEHIIRDESEYQEISRYIENNPLNWASDKYYI